MKKIPTKKYKKHDIPETCPICLDDFEEGDKLRILPCSHWYHMKCVDPWLTKNRKICPVCKQKVVKDDSDSSSNEDRAGPSPMTRQGSLSATVAVDERMPLISSALNSPDMHRYGSMASSYDSSDFDTSTVHQLNDDVSGTMSPYQLITVTPSSTVNRETAGSSISDSTRLEHQNGVNSAFEQDDLRQPAKSSNGDNTTT